MPSSPVAICLPVVAVAALAACSSGTAAKRSTDPSTSAGSSAAPACPAASPATFSWPAGVPSGVPKPAGGKLTGTKRLPNKGVVVSLSVPRALRDEVLFVRSEFPKAGLVLGRGDAEPDEADVPFRHGTAAGQLRLRDAGPCTTTWVLTIVGR